MTDREKLEKIKALADKMYSRMAYLTADTRPIREAMDEYHQFIINEYHKEEPVSIWHDASETPSIFGTYLLMHEDGWCVARYYGKDVPTGNITGWVEISQHIFIEKPKKWLDLREILPKTK